MQIVRRRRRRPDRPLRTKKVSFYVAEDQAEHLAQLASRQHRAVAVYLRRLVVAGEKARADCTAVIGSRRPQHPPRNTQMSFHVTDAEYNILDQRAQEAGLSMSNYLLALVEAGLQIMMASAESARKGPNDPPDHSNIPRSLA